MVAVTIVKGFTLTHDATTMPDDPHMHAKDEYIPVGVHDFPEEIASHWYVQAHSDNPPRVLPRPGTPEYGQHLAAAARRRMLVEASLEQEAQAAAAEVRQNANLSGRIAETEEQVQAEEQAEADAAVEAEAVNTAAREKRRVAIPQAPARRAPIPPAPAPTPLPAQGATSGGVPQPHPLPANRTPPATS